MAADGDSIAKRPVHLHSFRLYETRSNFYMIGRDKSKAVWRVLKIDRTEPSELNMNEDPTSYSESECLDLLKRIHEGNKSSGGLKFITNCYGIVGFAKFLGPYYMLLITKRKKIGAICGQIVYAISKSEMIALPHSTARSNMTYSKDENRYKKLLCTVDLTKDFFFSYSYNVMRSLQKNFCDGETGQVLYETMFVWNEFLTRGIRNHLKNTIWTVALVYGFFKQVTLSISGKDFKLTLIARRSRHYAGTRYLKRGVNEKGRVANDVETEQIVFDDTSGEIPTEISSVVQNRGSIPLFWSQETSWMNIKPDIILHKKNQNYEATRLHFDNLVKRYGNPIIILNLIKTREKKPRESILRTEFAKAIMYLNKDLPKENRLMFLHWDLHRHCRRKDTNVLALLGQVAAYAIKLTGFFYCQATPTIGGQKCSLSRSTTEAAISDYGSKEDSADNCGMSDGESSEYKTESGENCSAAKQATFQEGVLRTNCIDCLDRTNVAQYAYGLAALGYQLHAVGLTDVQKIYLGDPLADDLMHYYERMGDTLALQYGGSTAHNKIFSERRGQWKAAIKSQEFFRTIQRYCNNTYMDAEKQDAINVFLGHFQPQQGKAALWELDSDQYYNVGRRGRSFSDENARSMIKRSLSDGNIVSQSSAPVSSCNVGQTKLPNSSPRAMDHSGDAVDLFDSIPEMLNEGGISNSRHTSVMSHPQLSADSEYGYSNGHGLDASNSSNFVDLDWLSSSCEEEFYDRSSLANSPIGILSTENVLDGINSGPTPTISEQGIEESIAELSNDGSSQSTETVAGYPDSFVHWVSHGSTLCR